MTGDAPTLVFRGVGWWLGRVAVASLTSLVAGQVWESWPGKGWGNFPAGPVVPCLVPHFAVTLSVAVVVTLGECLGDVVGADHAVAVGFADLDALVG